MGKIKPASTVQLDDMLEPEPAAKWLKITKRDLLEKSRQRLIPVFELGPKTLRFHPRTIIAFFSRKAGLPISKS